MRPFLRRAWYAIRQRQFEADLSEEIEFHRTMKQRELEEGGLEPTEAAFATRRTLGSLALAQDHSRDVWQPRWLQGVGQDLRLAVRSLRATPVVTTVAILSLALGIGANTTIFSLVNSLLLRTLPVADAQRLAILTSPALSYRAPFSYATFEKIREHGQSFDGVLAYNCCGKSPLTIGGENQIVDRMWVSGDFFATLGVRALLGRTITLADDVAGGGPQGQVAMISYRLWQRRFGGATDIIGTSPTIERAPVTIVGVTPPNFFGVEVGRDVDVMLPIKTQPLVQPAIAGDADAPFLNIMLRLKPGQSLDAATAALRAVQPQIRAGSMPHSMQKVRAEDFLKDPFTLEPAGAGTSALRQRFQRPLVTILIVVALVLLIACGNIANLHLARGIARRREIAVRLALGASRWRLARQFLIESIVLAAIGAALGLVFATWASRALVAQLSTSVTRVVLDLSLDWRVLAFTGATMVATAILFGIAPALRATSVIPMEALKEHGRGVTGDSRGTLSTTLIVAQVALSLLLVITAALFVRTFEGLAGVSLGFDRDPALVVTVTAPTVPAADRNAFYHRLVQAAAAVPGVSRAGGSLSSPLIFLLDGDFVVTVPGAASPPEAERIDQVNDITPGWLAAYGTPIRAGRDIDDHDTMTTQPVMLVNEAFVRRFFPGRNLIGTNLAVTYRSGSYGDILLGSKTVIGVVGDAVYRSIRDPARPTVYFPLAQRDDPLGFTNFYIVMRSLAGSPVLLAHSVAAALHAVNLDLTLTFRPLADQVNESLAQDRLVALLSGFFGALALLLAALGLYGVTAYAVARRRTEIGIRIALGAEPSGVVRLVLLRVATLVGIGVAVGVGVSLWASQFVAALLYGVQPHDAATFIGAAVVLTSVAAVAAWLPAWRASRIDPAVILRCS
jgi:putative ABC transport system permease protein